MHALLILQIVSFTRLERDVGVYLVWNETAGTQIVLEK